MAFFRGSSKKKKGANKGVRVSTEYLETRLEKQLCESVCSCLLSPANPLQQRGVSERQEEKGLHKDEPPTRSGIGVPFGGT